MAQTQGFPSALPMACAFVALLALVGDSHAQDTRPPSAGDVTNMRERGLDDVEVAYFAQSVGTSTLNVMGNSASGGATEATFSVDTIQNFRIQNLHASQTVCTMIVDRGAAGTTCNAVCAAVGAGAFTCNAGGGVTTDGTPIVAGSVHQVPVVGTECLCVEATAASTAIHATRVSRRPNQ